jgi:hypothetical protein
MWEDSDNIIVDTKDAPDSEQRIYLVEGPQVLVALVIDAPAIPPKKRYLLAHSICNEAETSP